MNVKKYLKSTKFRIKGLRKDIKYLLITSILIVLSIELFFNKIEADFFTYQFELGIIFLKLSYSYISSFIFYYIVVYLPKERKRIKIYRFLNNQIIFINENVLDIIEHLNKGNIIGKKKNIKEADIVLLCKKTNPKVQITIERNHTLTFTNYYDFQNYKTKKIMETIKNILCLHDVLDDKLLYFMTNIYAIINNRLFTIDLMNIPHNSDIEFLSHTLYELYLQSDEMKNYFIEEFSQNYDYEYHFNERKLNVTRYN